MKLLRGETRPSRLRREPQPAARAPTAPDWLTEEARTVWDRTTPELEAMGLLFSADCDVLACYACAVAEYAQAQRLIDRDGLLVAGLHGEVRNPAVVIANEAARQIARFARELGLTPAARTGIGAPGKPDEQSRDLLAG